MQLNHYFHRSPDDNWHLNLQLDEGRLLQYGFDAGGQSSAYHCTPSGLPVAQLVAALRTRADELRALCYVELHHTAPLLRALHGDTTPKPPWQQSLDAALMAQLEEQWPVQAGLMLDFDALPPAGQPMGLWLLAAHAEGSGQTNLMPCIRRFVDAAAHLERSTAHVYRWSLPAGHLLAERDRLALAYRAWLEPSLLLEELRRAWRDGGQRDDAARLAAALLAHYPGDEEEAFDLVYRHAHEGGFARFTGRADYRAHAARRRADDAAGRGSWRWGTGIVWAGDVEWTALADGEGFGVPPSYLALGFADSARELTARFPAGDVIVEFRDGTDWLGYFQELLASDAGLPAGHRFQLPQGLSMSSETAAPPAESSRQGLFRQKVAAEHGFSLDALRPIASPDGTDSFILMHIEPGTRFGWCCMWHVERPSDLWLIQPSLDAMLATLTQGIEAVDPYVAWFLGIAHVQT